jgi:hypothetical protein
MVMDPRPLINYTTLWLLFKPGTYVYAQQSAFFGSPSSRRTPHGHGHDRDEDQDQDQDEGYSPWIVSSWSYDEKKPDFNPNDPDMMFDRFERTLWNVQHKGNAFRRTA